MQCERTHEEMWECLGPTNFSGRIKCLAVHPRCCDTLYAGSAAAGVWTSEDGGDSWCVALHGGLSGAVGALAVSQSDPTILYAATGEDAPGFKVPYAGRGVYKTMDAGRTWQQTGPMPCTRCTRAMIHPDDPDVVYIAGDAGLYRSSCGGRAWVLCCPGHVSDALMDPADPNTLYTAIWNSGIYKTTSGGRRWHLLQNGLPVGLEADWIALAMGLHGPHGTAFLAAKMGPGSGTVYLSRNGGKHWHVISDGQAEGEEGSDRFNTWSNLIAVHPLDERILFAGGPNLEWTTDGRSFQTDFTTHEDHQALVFSPSDPARCYLATDGGVYRSDTGGSTWTLASRGLITAQFYGVGVSQTDPCVLGGTTQDQATLLLHEPLTPDGWSQYLLAYEGGCIVVDPNASQTVYVAPFGALQRSQDAGRTWVPIVKGLEKGLDVTHLAVRPRRSRHLLCACGTRVYASQDQGDRWRPVLECAANVTFVAYASAAPQICFATTEDGRVYKSSEGGAKNSWSEPYVQHPLPTGYISGIASMGREAQTVYVAYREGAPSGVYRSEDGGVSWHPIGMEGHRPQPAVKSLALDPHSPNVLYIATPEGVYRYRHEESGWESFAQGLPPVPVSQLAARSVDATLYAATMGNGMYRCRLAHPANRVAGEPGEH